MAHGTPDWGVTAGGATTFQLSDLAELAVRLGSIVSFDRRGDVVWFDDFEGSLNKWTQTANGTGASVALSTSRAKHGLYSCALTAGSDGAAEAFITHHELNPVLGRFGLETGFSFEDSTKEVVLTLNYYDGIQRSDVQISWSVPDKDLAYRNASNGWTVFATNVDLLPQRTYFHTLKLVFGLTTLQYVRVILDNVTYKLPGAAAYTVADTTLPVLLVQLVNVGRLTFNDVVYVDYAILTQNEPA